MTKDLIPCSVQVLTHNNEATLGACLETLKSFAEVIVQDGYSTDRTRAIAQTFHNVRVLDQDRTLLDTEGRMTDFAAMRNIGLGAATHEWILMVDSDEEVSPDMAKEIKDIVSENIPGVYRVFRRFVVRGERIMRCGGYPAYHIRLFHKSCIDGYVKSVHEKLSLHSGVMVQTLRSELLVPLPPASFLREKYQRYLTLEVARQGIPAWAHWFRWSLFRNVRSILAILLRTAYVWIKPGKGKRMPIVYEWQAVQQLWWTTLLTFPPVARRRVSLQRVSVHHKR